MNKKPSRIAITDHLGNQFDSVRQLTIAWGINRHRFSRLLKQGVSIEEAIKNCCTKGQTEPNLNIIPEYLDNDKRLLHPKPQKTSLKPEQQDFLSINKQIQNQLQGLLYTYVNGDDWVSVKGIDETIDRKIVSIPSSITLKDGNATKELKVDLTSSCSNMFTGRNLTEFAITGDCMCSTTRSMRNMFKDCVNLKTVDMSKINLLTTPSIDGMFSGCLNLEEVKLPQLNRRTRLLEYARAFTGCSSIKRIELLIEEFDKNVPYYISSIMKGFGTNLKNAELIINVAFRDGDINEE